MYLCFRVAAVARQFLLTGDQKIFFFSCFCFSKPAFKQSAVLLIADDNAMMRKILSHHLAEIGFNPDNMVMACDGNDALARFVDHSARRRFDLLMLDCQMPFLSGPDVLARVRAAESSTGALKPVPAVMHSAGLLDEGVIAKLGGSGFIEKPFTRAKLLAALTPVFPNLPKV